MAWVGSVVLIVAVFLAMQDGYERYAIWTFGLAALMLVGGAIMAKGDVSERKVSADDLVIGLSEIRIGRVVYPMADVRELDFRVDGYEGMPDHYLYESDAATVDGMGNALRFQCGGVGVKCLFFLARREDVGKLADLFREFYKQGIPFREEFRERKKRRGIWV